MVVLASDQRDRADASPRIGNEKKPVFYGRMMRMLTNVLVIWIDEGDRVASEEPANATLVQST